MRSIASMTWLVLAAASGAWAGMKPVAFRLASLPATAGPGQKLVLCAANIGTGSVDVTLEFMNVKTASMLAARTVTLEPLGSGAAAQPCVTAEVPSAAAPGANPPMASSFASSAPALAASDGEALVVGVAMVRKPLLSFREAQVTASIQVMAPDETGTMHTVQTIPLSRAANPSDGVPVNTPAPWSGHRK